MGAAILAHLPVAAQYRIYTATHRGNPTADTERWLDFERPDSFGRALQQIDVVFLLRPPQLADVNTYLVPFIKACQEAGVKHIVFLSVQGSEKTPCIPHAKLETLIRQSGLAYTFIRPSYFMQNLTTTLRHDIVRHHRLFLTGFNVPASCCDAK